MAAPGTSFIDRLVSTTNSRTAGLVSGSTDQPSHALLWIAATCSGVKLTIPPVLSPGADPPPEVPLPTSSAGAPRGPGGSRGCGAHAAAALLARTAGKTESQA